MSASAKIYVSSIVLIGAAVTVIQLARWQSSDLVRFGCYLLLFVCASRLKVPLPGVSGALSVLFIFILFGIVELTLPEALLLGCVAILFQCLWNYRHRPRWHQVLFNVGSMAITIATAGAVYHSVLLRQGHLGPALRLLLTATVFFVMNTFPVAAIIALTERKSLRQVWRDCYIWTFPYYLLGAVIAGAASAINREFGWQTALLAVPVVYLIYRSYYLYLGRMEDEKKHAEEMASLHLRTIEALALAIEAKDHTTHDHLQRVQVYAVEIGKELGLDETRTGGAARGRPAARHRQTGGARAHHLETRKADPRRVREDEDSPGGGRRDSGTRPLPLSGGAHRALASREMGWHGLSGRPEGRRDSHRRAHSGGGGLSGRAGFRPAVPARAAAR